MKSGRSITELAAELERQSNAKKDFLVDTREMTVFPPVVDEDKNESSLHWELHLPEGEGEYRMRQLMHRQVGDHLHVPAKFYDYLREGHPSLLAHNVNTLFREAPARRMVRTFDFGDEGRFARAYLSDRYRRLDNDQLANAVLPILAEIPDVQIPTCQITETKMYITALAPRLQADVKVGDTVQAGVRFTNSEVGNGAMKVEPIVYRLVCLNGMTVAKAIRQFHIGRQLDSDDTISVLSDETLRMDDDAFFAKLMDVTRAAVDETQFQAIVAQMREAAETEKMEKPLESMERLQKRFSFGEGEKESILKHLIEGGDLTAYGALNAVTRAAQDVDSYDRSMELEQVGGQILEMASTKEWAALAAA